MDKSEVLIKAADLIEQRGHAHHRYVTTRGSVCAMGAIRLACGATVDNHYIRGPYLNESHMDFRDVIATREGFYKYLRANAEKYGIDTWSDSIPNWNDRNDKDTVVSAMREAAKWVKERETDGNPRQ